jgi:hypothetical protein
MTPDAERLHVLEAALAAALGHAQDVIRVPETVTAFDLERVLDGLKGPGLSQSSQYLAKENETLLQLLARESTLRAAAAISLPYERSDERRIGLELPGLDAGGAAEGSPPLGDFLSAVPAEAAPAGAARETRDVGPAGLGTDAVRAHSVCSSSTTTPLAHEPL